MKSNVSLSRRLGAIVYDIILAFCLAFFIGILFVSFFNKQAQISTLTFVIYLLINYFYFVYSWVKGGQTLGMKAWKFHIQKINGGRITHKQGFIRFILAIVSFCIAGLGFIYQLYDKDNLALHDTLSNTQLIKNPCAKKF